MSNKTCPVCNRLFLLKLPVSSKGIRICSIGLICCIKHFLGDFKIRKIPPELKNHFYKTVFFFFDGFDHQNVSHTLIYFRIFDHAFFVRIDFDHHLTFAVARMCFHFMRICLITLDLNACLKQKDRDHQVLLLGNIYSLRCLHKIWSSAPNMRNNISNFS